MEVPTRLLSLSFHGWTLVQALQHPAACMSRTVDCLELWAGVGSVAHAARNMGFKSIAVDKLDCPDGACTELYDITSRKGFERAMTYVLSVVVGGLLVMAPCCSSFGFLNLSKTKRSVNNPEGDISYNKVQDGNSQAMAAAFLFALASIRSVKAVVENPTSSWLFKLPVWRLLSDVFSLKYTNVARCYFDTAQHGKRMLKIYKFAGLQWSCSLRAKCNCPGRKHIKLTRKYTVNNKMKTSGIRKQLKQSQVYPKKLGEWIVKHWKASQRQDARTILPDHRGRMPGCQKCTPVQDNIARGLGLKSWKTKGAHSGASRGQSSSSTGLGFRSWKA